MQSELTVMQESVEFNNSKQILSQLTSERDELKRKIEEATRNGEIDLLAELRDRLFEVEEMELPLAELVTLEAAVDYWKAALQEAQWQEIETRANFDGVFDARERSIAELRKLIHDESRELSVAQEKYLGCQYELREIGDQLSLYQQRLRELQSRSDKTGIRQAQLGPLTLSYIALI